MRHSIISLILLVTGALVSSTPVDSIQALRNDVTVLDARQEVSIITINPPNPLTPIFDYLKSLQNNKTPEAKVEVKEAGNPSDSETAVQLLQKSLTSLKADNTSKQNGLSAIAVRFGKLQFPIAWDGIIGQDWGHTVITMDAADGQSLWDYYWVKSGKITVTSSNIANDVALGGAYYVTNDPTNPNVKTITILPTP